MHVAHTNMHQPSLIWKCDRLLIGDWLVSLCTFSCMPTGNTELWETLTVCVFQRGMKGYKYWSGPPLAFICTEPNSSTGLLDFEDEAKAHLPKFHWNAADWFSGCRGAGGLMFFGLHVHGDTCTFLSFSLFIICCAEIAYWFILHYLSHLVTSFWGQQLMLAPLTHDQWCGLLTWITDLKSM